MKQWLRSKLWIYFSAIAIALSVITAITLVGIVIAMEFFDVLPNFEHSPRLGWIFPIVFCSLVGFTIASVVIHLILNPIIKLKKAMSKVIDSDFSVQLDEEQPIAEVQELYHAFNLMVKELGSIQRLQSEFTSVISHEFKTPLSSIQGYAQLLQSPDLPPDTREVYQQKIIIATKQLSSLSDNILKLTKLDNQSLAMERREFRLDEQIRESILALHQHWVSKNLTLTIDLDKVTFKCNEELLAQVWTNLLDNAIKYNTDGGQLIIQLSQTAHTVHLTIEDTGIGIPEDKLPYVFERFYQVDPSRFSSGNGLGLALVKRIIDLHNGDIRYTSTLGEGTKVVITLPLEKD